MPRQIKEEMIYGETYLLDAETEQRLTCPYKDCCCTVSCVAYHRLQKYITVRGSGGEPKDTVDRSWCGAQGHDLIIGDF